MASLTGVSVTALLGPDETARWSRYLVKRTQQGDAALGDHLDLNGGRLLRWSEPGRTAGSGTGYFGGTVSEAKKAMTAGTSHRSTCRFEYPRH